jgi:phage protein D
MPNEDFRELTPEFAVTVNGNDLPPEAQEAVDKIRVEESVDAAGMFVLQLNNFDLDTHQVKWSDADLFQVGGRVEVRMGYLGALETLMVGEITGLEPAFAEGHRSVLTVRGYDRLHRLRRRRRRRSFLQIKDSQVAEQIARDLGLTPQVEDSQEVHPYLFQNNQTDIDFLLTRARAIGYEMLVENQTLVFRKRKHEQGQVVTLQWEKDLMTFFPVLTTVPQVSQVVVRGWDRQAKRAIVATATTSDIPTQMQGAQLGPAAAENAFGTTQAIVVECPVASALEADQMARGLMNEVALTYITGEGTTVGNAAIRAGTVIELRGLGQRFSGLYYVTTAVHTRDERGYVTGFTVRRNAS